MRLAGAACQGDRYDASLVGPNEDNNDSQDELSNSVPTQDWLVRLGERIVISRRSHPSSAAGHTCRATPSGWPPTPRADESVS